MKQGKNLQQLADEIVRQAKARADFVCHSDAVQMVDDGVLRLAAPGGEKLYKPTLHCERQIGEWSGIPARYYDRMRDEAPELLRQNVNHWLRHSNQRRLLRCFAPDDDGEVGTARAWLSDRYRMLDNHDLAEHLLPQFRDVGLDLVSCELTERRLYIKGLHPDLKHEVVTKGAYDGGEHDRVETLQAGIVVSNSEIGGGRLSVSPACYTVRCTNMATFADQGFAQAHLGRALDSVGEVAEYISDETKAATDRAVWLSVRDAIGAALDSKFFARLVERHQNATTDKMDGARVEPVVRAALPDASDAEHGSILDHLIRGGDFSRFGLHSAVTRASADVESYDRASDLERAGGRIIEMSRDDWSQVLRKAA